MVMAHKSTPFGESIGPDVPFYPRLVRTILLGGGGTQSGRQLCNMENEPNTLSGPTRRQKKNIRAYIRTDKFRNTKPEHTHSLSHSIFINNNNNKTLARTLEYS